MNNGKERDTSQKILNAAYKCISAKGYANVSLRDIAEEAGVYLSQLSYYYKNKEGLFNEVVKAVRQENMQYLEKGLKQGTTTKDNLSLVVQYSQVLIKENTDIYRVLLDFFNMAMWSQSLNKELGAFLKEISNIIEKYIINDCTLKENVQVYPPNAITRLIVGAVFGIAMQYILEPENEDLLESLNIIQAMIE